MSNIFTASNETSIVALKAKSIEVNGSDVETYLNYLTTYLNEVNEKNEELKKKIDETYYRRGVSY